MGSAAALAEGIIDRGEVSPITWLHGALAIRRHRSIEAARAFLLRADGSMEGYATFHYTLATFECQLEDMPAAKRGLARAVGLNLKLRAVALEDSDLAAIW